MLLKSGGRHFHIRTILTDNGKEFTDRLFASRKRDASGHHVFDQLCTALGIEHRLTTVRHPQTNGMLERFNGRIAEILRTHHFESRDDLDVGSRMNISFMLAVHC